MNPLTTINAPMTKHITYPTTDGLDDDPDDPDFDFPGDDLRNDDDVARWLTMLFSNAVSES